MLMSPNQILSKMEELFPDAKSELINWKTPFQFLVCIVLSAQTTDRGVNSVTSKLFTKFPDANALSKANVKDVENLIKSVNYFRTKAKRLVELSRMVIEEFNGDVPDSVVELIKLPGVGEKTANVFLNDLYRRNEGIGVDTHVMRVARRLGLTNNHDPKKIAKDLESIFSKKDWWRVNTLFVLYGRYICKANMKETKCVFRDICSYCKHLPLSVE
jgi:endonuclease III